MGIGIGIVNSSTFQIPFHSYSIVDLFVVVTNLFTMLFNFKFHSNSTVDGMECGISVWYWVLLGASLCPRSSPHAPCFCLPVFGHTFTLMNNSVLFDKMICSKKDSSCSIIEPIAKLILLPTAWRPSPPSLSIAQRRTRHFENRHNLFCVCTNQELGVVMHIAAKMFMLVFCLLVFEPKWRERGSWCALSAHNALNLYLFMSAFWQIRELSDSAGFRLNRGFRQNRQIECPWSNICCKAILSVGFLRRVFVFWTHF